MVRHAHHERCLKCANKFVQVLTHNFKWFEIIFPLKRQHDDVFFLKFSSRQPADPTLAHISSDVYTPNSKAEQTYLQMALQRNLHESNVFGQHPSYTIYHPFVLDEEIVYFLYGMRYAFGR